jgi:hypothetical protein
MAAVELHAKLTEIGTVDLWCVERLEPQLEPQREQQLEPQREPQRESQLEPQRESQLELQREPQREPRRAPRSWRLQFDVSQARRKPTAKPTDRPPKPKGCSTNKCGRAPPSAGQRSAPSAAADHPDGLMKGLAKAIRAHGTSGRRRSCGGSPSGCWKRTRAVAARPPTRLAG